MVTEGAEVSDEREYPDMPGTEAERRDSYGPAAPTFNTCPDLPDTWTRTYYVRSKAPLNKDAIEWYIIRYDSDTQSPAGLAYALDPERGWVPYEPGALVTDIRPTVTVDGLTLARTTYLSELEDRVTLRMVDLLTRAGCTAVADWINTVRNDLEHDENTDPMPGWSERRSHG
jgi:hypothetical protein